MDHHFPRYHLRPPSGYVNDPNGPVRLGDRWHLFFQFTSDTVRNSAVVWGHGSSDDLAHWQLHRPALSPDPSGIDRDGCWSGNVVAIDGELIAFYSGYRREHPYQSVLAATSTDGGQSFGPGRQVIPDPSPDEEIVEFRDPFVWRQDDGWLMVVGAGNAAGQPFARLYSSTDLWDWVFVGPYASGGDVPDVGQLWECPQLLSFGDRDALLVGTWDAANGINEVLALTGVRSDNTLPDPHLELVDHGPNYYAASGLRESEYGPIVWAWITEGRPAEWAVESGWSGVLSLPRTASLTTDGRLATQPVDTLRSLRKNTISDKLGAQFEIECELTGHRGGDPTRITLHCADEHLDIEVDWATGQVSVNRDHASLDPRADRGVYSFHEPDIQASGSLRLRWFVDGSVSELFTGSGRSCTVRFYPTNPPPWTLTIANRTPDDRITAYDLSP